MEYGNTHNLSNNNMIYISKWKLLKKLCIINWIAVTSLQVALKCYQVQIVGILQMLFPIF